MGIKELIQKFLVKRNRMKEVENENNMMEKIEMKKLSANERELIKFKNREREENIKNELESYRKVEHDRTWHGRTSLDDENMFRKKSPSLIGCPNLFASPHKQILNERSNFW